MIGKKHCLEVFYRSLAEWQAAVPLRGRAHTVIVGAVKCEQIR